MQHTTQHDKQMALAYASSRDALLVGVRRVAIIDQYDLPRWRIDVRLCYEDDVRATVFVDGGTRV
jgi:hypothetical protein